VKPACLCLRLLTTKIKAYIDFITKTKKKKDFVDVLCIFFLAENLYFDGKQTNRKLTITLDSKIPLDVQQK